MAGRQSLSRKSARNEDRDFTAEAQRGKRGRSRKGLNTKAPRHKGQRERDAWEKFKFESEFK